MAKAKNSFVPSSEKNSSAPHNEHVITIIIHNNQKTNYLYIYNNQNKQIVFKISDGY